MKIFKLIPIITILVSCHNNFAWAQTVEEMNAAAAIAAETARINAQAALNESEVRLRASRLNEALGATAATGNQGTITLPENSQTHFAQDLVYESMHEAANDIRVEICEGASKYGRVIFGEPDTYARAKRQLMITEGNVRNLLARVNDLKEHIGNIDATTLNRPSRDASTRNRPLTSSQLEALAQLMRGEAVEPSVGARLNSLVDPATITTIITALPLIAGQFDSVASLFRSDYTLAGANVSVSEATLIRSIKRSLFEERKGNSINTTCPQINEPQLLINPRLPLQDEMATLTALMQEMQSAWNKKNAELLARRPAANTPTETGLNRADYDSVIAATSAQVTASNTVFTTLNNGLFNPNTAGATRIDTFQVANSLSNDTRFVAVTTEQSSALAIQKSKPLASTKLNYTGIFVVSYEIKKLDGEYISIGFINKSKCRRAKKKDGYFNPQALGSRDCENADQINTAKTAKGDIQNIALNNR